MSQNHSAIAVLFAIVLAMMLPGPAIFPDHVEANQTGNRILETNWTTTVIYDGELGPPRNLTVMPGPDHIEITWEPPLNDGGAPIVGYKLWRGDAGSNASGLASLIIYASIPPSVLAYHDTGVIVGGRYYYMVSASNGQNESFSPESEWAVVGGGVPGGTKNLRATAGGHQVNLTWTCPSYMGGTEVREYNLYRGLTEGNESFLTSIDVPYGLHSVFDYELRFTDTGLVNGQRYFYRVSAVNSIGEGPVSTSESARPNFAPLLYIRTGEISGGKLDITVMWRPPAENLSEVTGYRVYYKDDGGPADPWILLATVGPLVNAFNDTVDVHSGRGYKVAAIYSSGDEVFSNTSPSYLPYFEGGYSDISIDIVVIISIIGLAVASLILVTGRRKH